MASGSQHPMSYDEALAFQHDPFYMIGDKKIIPKPESCEIMFRSFLPTVDVIKRQFVKVGSDDNSSQDCPSTTTADPVAALTEVQGFKWKPYVQQVAYPPSDCDSKTNFDMKIPGLYFCVTANNKHASPYGTFCFKAPIQPMLSPECHLFFMAAYTVGSSRYVVLTAIENNESDLCKQALQEATTQKFQRLNVKDNPFLSYDTSDGGRWMYGKGTWLEVYVVGDVIVSPFWSAETVTHTGRA